MQKYIQDVLVDKIWYGPEQIIKEIADIARTSNRVGMANFINPLSTLLICSIAFCLWIVAIKESSFWYSYIVMALCLRPRESSSL